MYTIKLNKNKTLVELVRNKRKGLKLKIKRSDHWCLGCIFFHDNLCISNQVDRHLCDYVQDKFALKPMIFTKL